MAKDGKKNDGKKGNPIPKEIAGIKLPKELRKAGRKAVKLVKDPVVSEVVAAVLLSAAAALRAGTKEKSGSTPAADAAKTAQDAAKTAKREASAVGDAVKLLAVDFARRTIEGVGDRQRSRRTKADSKP
jgi:hypothetical protein